MRGAAGRPWVSSRRRQAAVKGQRHQSVVVGPSGGTVAAAFFLTSVLVSEKEDLR